MLKFLKLLNMLMVLVDTLPPVRYWFEVFADLSDLEAMDLEI